MTSRDHHPGSAGGTAPGSQPAHPGNATRRAAAVMRQTPATSQAGRSASPGRDMDVRSARPRRAHRSPAASLRSGLRQQTASARPRSRTAAHSIIETPERPAPYPACPPPPDHPHDARRRRTADRPRHRTVRSEPGCLRHRLAGSGKGQAMNLPEDLAGPSPRSKGGAS